MWVPSSPLLPWLTQSPHEGSRALGVNQAPQSLVNLPAEMDPCLWGSSLTTPGEQPPKQAGTPPGFSPLPLYPLTQGSQHGCTRLLPARGSLAALTVVITEVDLSLGTPVPIPGG